ESTKVGTVVGQVPPVRPSVPGRELVWWDHVNPDDNPPYQRERHFAVDEDGTITLARPLDADCGGNYSVTVTVSETPDPDGGTISYQLTVYVTNDRVDESGCPIEIRPAEADPDDGKFCYSVTFNPCEPCGADPATLLWCSEGNPHPLVHLDVKLPSASPPDSYEAFLKVGGQSVPLLRGGQAAASQSFSTSGLAGGEWHRMTLQFDASSLASGYHDYEVRVRAKDSSGQYLTGSGSEAFLHGRLAVVNRTQSEFGNRWWLPVLDRLDLDEAAAGGGGVGLIRGDGSSAFFHSFNGGYTAEAGVFDTLAAVKDINGVTTEYALQTADGRTRYYDAAGARAGFLTRIVDRNGRAQTLTYGDADADGVSD
ncbi:MAG TPA: cadherin repeat domain-containing protein, partial [Planctomycetaceae bacterium]